MMIDLTTPLTTRGAAMLFIRALQEEDKMFHFEDDPDTIINGRTGCMLFTEEEAEQVTARLNEIYSFDWADYDCPIGYALSIDPNYNPED